MIAYAAAVCAALFWAFGGLIAVTPVHRLGPIRFNRIRMPLVFIILSLMALVSGGWFTVKSAYLGAIAFSSIIGIFLGDSALFFTINRLGPRRTSIIFATNAPMTAIISFLVFNERLELLQIAGCCIVLSGVILAIVYGTTATSTHRWEQVRGSTLLGVATGLFAALCQAGGAIIIKPVMEQGADPIAISAMRVGISGLLLSMTILNRRINSAGEQKGRPDTRLILWVALSGFVGMAMGMTFLLFALANGEAGIVTTLAATTPVMMLPLLWIKTGERPAIGSWFGALLTVIGSGILFNF